MKKYVSCLLILSLLLSSVAVFSVSATAAYDAAWIDSAVGNVYTVADEADLLAFSKALSEGKSFEGKVINLTADITMTPNAVSAGVTWYAASGDFKGVFDGQGHTVSGIHYTTSGHAGIFGGGSRGGTVRNLSITDSSITATAAVSVGSVFGRAMDQGSSPTTTLENIYADVDITVPKGENVGGLIGVRWGAANVTISHCVYAGTVTVNGAGDGCGGIFGQVGENANAAVTIRNCGFFGTVTTAEGGSAWGKLVGKITGAANTVAIESCIAAGTLSTPKAASAGIGAVYGAKSGAASTVSIGNTVYTAVTVNTNVAYDGLTGSRSDAETSGWINLPTTDTGNILKTNTELFGIKAQAVLPSGWTASTLDTEYPIPNGLIGIAPSRTAGVKLHGYQPSATVTGESFSIRLVATVNALTEEELAGYQSVGFRVSARCYDAVGEEISRTAERSSHTVYEALTANTQNGYLQYTKDQLGGYIFALNCNGIPANSGKVFFSVIPFAVTAMGTMTEGREYRFALDPTAGDGALREPITELELPLYAAAAPSNEGGEGANIYTYTNVSIEQLAAYEKTLVCSGYVKHSSNVIGDNRFATYVGYTDEVHLVYNPALGNRLRVVHTALGDLPNATEPTYTAVVTPSLTQLARAGAEDNGSDSAPGMSYVLQLADGRFLIIDGGPENQADINSLMQFLTDNKPATDAKPRVSWLFTHAHGDHMGLALAFLNQKHGDIVLESVYFNFPQLSEMNIPNESASAMAVFTERLTAALNTYYPAAARVRCHTGQKIMLPDCAIEVLFTHEDYYPNEFSWGNHTSAAFRITVREKSFVVLGDAEVGLCNQMATIYGNALKSDILQPSHHGLNGGTQALYELIRPTYCLWPIDATRFASKVPTFSASVWLKNFSTYDYHASETETVYFTQSGLQTAAP